MPIALTLVVALLLLVSSIAGPLFGSLGLYDQEGLAASAGQDAIGFVVALPLLVGSLVLASRRGYRPMLQARGQRPDQ